MASYTSNTYQGRVLTLTVTQSGEYFNWTLTSSGGSSKYYSVYNVKASINGTQIFNYGNVGWSTYKFPAATGSTSGSVYIGGASRNITINFYGKVWSSSGSGTDQGGQMWYDNPYGYFNMNIMNPSGGEDGAASGSVEFSSNGGASYTRVSNEPASSYLKGTSFVFRNFTPATGKKLNSVGGATGSGPWYATQGDSTTVTFYTAWLTYTIGYAANGGTSTPGNQTKTYGQALTLAGAISRNNTTGTGYTTTFNGNGGTYTGSSTLTATDTYSYTFAGWKSSASGTTYGASGSFNENNAATMTAQWNTTTTRGSITLPAASTVSRPYYTFKGWNTSSTATTGSTGTYTPTSSTTMYAIWELNPPASASIDITRTTRTKIFVNVSAAAAEISNYTVYYRANSTGDYSSLSLGTSTTGTITGLQPNTAYQIYVKATNAKGNINSSTVIGTTIPFTPIVSEPTVVTPHPFEPVLRINAIGDTNASITNYTLYWCENPHINTYELPVKVTPDGALWLRIFFHNVNEGTVVFNSVDEVLNTTGVHKYSKLYLINDDTTLKGLDGKYEFMLCYPNDTTEYNRWKQTNAPQNVYLNNDQATPVPGYEPIHIDWTGDYWGGLGRRHESPTGMQWTYIKGSAYTGYWWYALGVSEPYQNIGMPGPNGFITASCVELWIRAGTVNASSKSFGSSNIGQAEGLQEETNYWFWGQATNAGGTTTGPAKVYTTPADQAKIYRKKDGTWERGKTYYKKDGTWVKAKKIYIKVNGEWKINSNGGS